MQPRRRGLGRPPAPPKPPQSAEEVTSPAASADSADYVDAILDVMDDPAVTDEVAQCFAEAYVATVGVDRLADADVTPDVIREDQIQLGLLSNVGLQDALWVAANDGTDVFLLYFAHLKDTLTEEQQSSVRAGVGKELVKAEFTNLYLVSSGIADSTIGPIIDAQEMPCTMPVFPPVP